MFPCLKKGVCPENNNPKRGAHCPAWVEGDLMHRHLETGEVKQTKGCYFQVSIAMLVESVQAAHRPAEEISAMRDQTVKAMVMSAERLLCASEYKQLSSS